MTRRVFGTYRLAGETLELALDQALGAEGAALHLIDTAAKYLNQHTVAKVVKRYPEARVGSKVDKPKTIDEDLAEMVGLFGSQLYRVLLHRPMGIGSWRKLEELKRRGQVAEIGVSNYSAELLEELLAECDLRPDVVQNEMHACISTPVPAICKREGIRFEAHTIMAANEHLGDTAEKLGCSVGQVAAAFALANGVDVCFSTINLHHLREVMRCEPTLLSRRDMRELSMLSVLHPKRLYRPQGTAKQTIDDLVLALSADIEKFHRGEDISDLCVRIPKSWRNPEVALQIAAAICPGPKDYSRAMFDGLLRRMRKVVEDRKLEQKRANTGPKVCAFPQQFVAEPAALPVDIPDGAVFDGFFSELGSGPAEYTRRLERGVLFPDGRMDLCKQVVRPRFIELCDTLRTHPNTGVKHFLMGNNVVFEGDPTEVTQRLDAFTRLVSSDPHITTWYIAGNGITADLSAPVAEAFAAASQMTALWLKMNPVKTGAVHFGRLASRHESLRMLDLFNTGLEDAGVEGLARGLEEGRTNLEDLYLSINGITDGGAVARVVRACPRLRSLFVGLNPLGDAGARPLLEALVGHPTLERLEIGAAGLTDASLPLLLQVAESPQLKCLVLSSYKSTVFFAGEHNNFTDLPGICALAQQVKGLGLNSAVPSIPVDALEQALGVAAPETVVMATGLARGGAENEVFRLLSHPEQVENIDSIYRNECH
mmetsp:Transcript_112652/g.258058  ORF Transcript_112652/g.258058 Transcript_112652/m.258058 type:complete len:711 (-) Transcript_112652:77-2209(-)|eukprot:CAMPEP_0204318948 /NCGR_PEP_ID=MMETSP0469-20131031/6821_1 /ASSEMBLY_ACC=CAM_ASM_000384 /TAXON_ID=2969 /ORGANISM="Oxyrrhis marina" /LENGTH=710 /DNA_ID=CAMNT_0051300061 /DNA_START=26 /DNA_END=2158 /DNA_ORIENTATION=-